METDVNSKQYDFKDKQMEYEKKPKHNDAETNELRNKITRLER